MGERHEIHVISNTHWDREWLSNFQETRAMLVEFFDLLLDVLDAHPDYDSFLLDSQAVPVEDYLEIRPENRDRVQTFVASKRIYVGPWYTCPECFSVTGESLVRNLLYGHRVAREFGGVMKVGHTPFSYGQNSQMPQIYQGFGIDTMLFYHGVSHDEMANEFIFEGADGSRVLGSLMSSGARYNMYHEVYRPTVYGKTIDERGYDWPEGGAPFRLCDQDRPEGHHLLLDPQRGFDAERARECAKRLRDKEVAVATTPYLAFMMGHDSSVPDPVTLRLIEEARAAMPDVDVFHSNLPALMEKVKAAVGDLQVFKGERRTPKLMNQRIHLYSDVLSSRSRMKRLNAHAELRLQRWTEPWAAVAALLGAEFPQAFLDLAWKTLLKCHAHDSISGSGVDAIEEDVTNRLKQVVHISDALLHRSLGSIQRRINNAGDSGDIFVTVFNASPYARSEVLTAHLDLPRSSTVAAFELEDADGVPRPAQLALRRPHPVVMNHAGDATYMMDSERATVHFETGEVPALGYTTYKLRKAPVFARGSLVTAQNAMENQHLRVRIEDNGSVSVLHKVTHQWFQGLNTFEDSGEAGNAWMHIEPALDRVFSSRTADVTVALEEDGPLLARYRIRYTLKVPASLDENRGDPWQRLDGGGSASKRSDAMVPLLIDSVVTLRRDACCLEFETRVQNTARDHRLRVKFPTHRKTDMCHVESAFDIVERPIVHGPESPWYGGHNATFPMQRFVDVTDQKGGLTVINDGLREYEVTADSDRAIAFTLFRAYEIALTTVSKCWERHPEMTLSQCFGEHTYRYRVFPHACDWRWGDILREAEALTVPLQPAQAGPHEGDLPQRMSFFAIEPDLAVLSAVKLSEDGNAVVVRVFNPMEKPVDARLTCAKQLASANRVTLEEVHIEALQPEHKSVAFTLGPKKIETLKLTLR